MIGWKMMDDEQLSSTTHQGHLKYIDRMICKNRYSNDYKRFVSKEKFCASVPSGNVKFKSSVHILFIYNYILPIELCLKYIFSWFILSRY